MVIVKIEISMEESLFDEAGVRARRLGISRSQLLKEAVKEFVRRRENEDLLERINTAHADKSDGE